jgi:hypothetical protein
MKGLSAKALLVGSVGVVAACAIVCWAELVITYIQIGILQFPPVVVGLFLFLSLGNAGLRRICSRLGLSPQEVMVVYCMMLIGAMIASRGLMEKLIPALVAVNYFTTPENSWRSIFYPHIKPWMVPFDPAGPEKQDVAVKFYQGLYDGETIPWHLWRVPLISWAVFVGFVFLGFLCLAAILRKQWVDNERLPFPLVELPLELARPETAGPFLRNRLTWIGLSIPAFVFGLNGLSTIYPSLPAIRVDHYLNQYLPPVRPWSDLFFTPAYLSFAAVGFAYLLPLDLVFSLWFFFVLTRFQDIAASTLGMTMDAMPLYPTHLIQGYQVMGAYLVLVIFLAHSSRRHLSQVLARALRRDPRVDDSRELLPYRFAVFGLAVSFIGSVAWCHAAGMTWWMAALEMFVYLFVVVVVMARTVAECGLLMTETSFRPMDVVTLFTSKDILGPKNLTALSFTDAVFTRDLRGVLLTAFMDGLRISDGVRLRRRSLVWAFLVAMVLAIGVAGTLHLLIPYHRGGVTLYSYVYEGNPLWGFQDNGPNILGAHSYDWRAPAFFGVGVIVTAFLALMRAYFAWWPFHPIGYAVSASWTMIVFWFPCLLAWVIKWLILRYGGMRLFVHMRPFFLGMVLAEFSMAVIWTAINFFARVGSPFFPWP